MKSAKKRIKRGKMPATIKDLARETGLSVATISAYINGEKVREVNREKIENAIAKLGYIRNDYARSLKMRSSKTIGVVVPDMRTRITMRLIAEIQKELRFRGYAAIIADSRGNSELENETFRFMLSKMVDGFIILPVSEDKRSVDILVDSGKPMVVINSMSQRSDVSHVIIDNSEAFRQAIDDMLSRNRRNIALLYSKNVGAESPSRAKAFKKILKEAGVYEEKYFCVADCSINGGAEAIGEILEKHPEIDAILAMNYETCMGALAALFRYELTWFKRISFVGVNLGKEADMFYPRPATVDLEPEQIAAAAVRLVVDEIEKGEKGDVVLKTLYRKGGILKKNPSANN